MLNCEGGWRCWLDAEIAGIHAAHQWRTIRTFDGAGPVGHLGPEGRSGPDGFVGPEGRSGPDGFVGPAGRSGPDGFVGPEGRSGPDGFVGPEGRSGPDGFVGPEGRSGPDGGRGPGVVGPEGRCVVSFASNDYLGLSSHPSVVAAGHEALDRWGAGSGASRLVVGTRPIHAELEANLAEWKGAEAALLWSSGYSANLGVLTTLAGSDVTIYSDERNHASVIDGCRLAKGNVVIFRHLDVEQLAGRLRLGHGRALVVTESVFSMDGDVAPIADLIEVCRRYRAMLVLDEAHAVLGPDLGELPEDLDFIRVGTLSKALGSSGGFVVGPTRWVDLIVNRARPFIFTTATTPVDTATALAALRILRSGEGADRLRQLRANIDMLRPGHPSPIVPVILGSERQALAASAGLLERGLLVPAIRPPTVPAGTSRLRIALSAAHTSDQVQRLAAAMDECGVGFTVAP